MKKTNLFCFALLMTGASFAQTTVQTEKKVAGTAQLKKQTETAGVTGSGSASASSTAQSNAAGIAANKAKSTVAKTQEVVTPKAERVSATGNTAVEKVSSKEVSTNASVNSNTNVRTNENQAQVNGNGSINAGTTVSLNKINDQATTLKQEVATGIENKTDATLKQTTAVTKAARTKATGTGQATTTVAATTTTNVVGAVRVKPSPVKVKTQVNTVAGIQLR